MKEERGQPLFHRPQRPCPSQAEGGIDSVAGQRVRQSVRRHRPQKWKLHKWRWAKSAPWVKYLINGCNYWECPNIRKKTRSTMIIERIEPATPPTMSSTKLLPYHMGGCGNGMSRAPSSRSMVSPMAKLTSPIVKITRIRLQFCEFIRLRLG